jgi:predicted ester cyclase
MAAPTSPEEVVRAWNKAYTSLDLDATIEFMSDDFRRLGDCTRWTPVGKHPWAADQKGFFQAFPNWSWEMTSLVVAGDTVVCEFLEHGTFTKPYHDIARIVGGYLNRPVPGLVLQPTGESYEDHNADCFRVKDGKITEIRAYITNNLERTFHFERKIGELIAANQQDPNPAR